MRVALFGHEVEFRWRTLIFAFFASLFGACILYFSYFFVKSFIAIRSGGEDMWANERLDSSVSRAVANTNVTPNDLKALAPSGRPSMGPESSKLTVVAFLDYGCPYSRKADGAFRETMLKYQNQVHFVVRDFPIEELHPNAFQAAHASRCVFAQGKGWAFHDALFAQTGDINPADFERFATQAGADLPKFRDCMDRQLFAGQVQQDLSDGINAGVQGTPTYFFNGVRIQGAPANKQAEYFDYLIQRFLKSATTSSTTPVAPSR